MRNLKQLLSRRLFVVVILISLFMRFIHIENPIVGERHDFRQTQTAIVVQTWIKEGIDVLRYQTPVLGEPWTLPFEFPIYQLCAYGMHIILAAFGLLNLDIAMRVTNIVFFYGCVFFLYRISIYFFQKKQIAKFVCVVFFLLPFSIFWSRTSMIEFAAVFFGLGYVTFFGKFLNKQKWMAMGATILFGCLGYLAKSTTMLPYCLFLAFIILRHLFVENYFSKTAILSRPTIVFCLKLLLMVVLPLIVGVVWVKWSDHIKDISGFSALTSKSLAGWNFGTASQKLNVKNWYRIILNNHIDGIIPVTIVFLCFLSLFIVTRKRENFIRAIAPAMCAFITVFVFFNLYYVHDYYFCAILPFICMSIVYTFYAAIDYIADAYLKTEDKARFIAILVIIFMVTVYRGNPYTSEALNGRNLSNYKLFELGEYIINNTKTDDKIMVFDLDWSSALPYYTNRKALMAQPWIQGEGYAAAISQYELFIMNNSSNQNDRRKSLLSEIVLETTIGDFNVYRRIK